MAAQQAPRPSGEPRPSARPKPAHPGAGPPANPVLARIHRGPWVESQHRGAWVHVDAAGAVLDGAGDSRQLIFARSSLKSVQALPLIESGAAERFGMSADELALALSSHNGEPAHTERVAKLLARLELTPEHLQCGPQMPADPATRQALEAAGQRPQRLHNNCSGKHAGFLALALHLGQDPATYLDPEGPSQRLVRAAVSEMTGAGDALTLATDGCSAPTFRLPLCALARAIARVVDPSGLPEPRRRACERLVESARAFPELIAGRHKRLCTELLRETDGRLFPKIGGEAVYVVGDCGGRGAFALKIEDGSQRPLHAVVLALCQRLGFLEARESERLAGWGAGPLTNWAGLEVGRVEVLA